MSTAPFELENPYELREPDPFLTPQEQAYHQAIQNTDTRGNLGKAALSLVAAFYGYRWYMRRKLRKNLEGKPLTAESVRQASLETFSDYRNIWVRTIMPSLVSGYVAGLADVAGGNISSTILSEVAAAYAWELGEHINEVSTEALVMGFQAQLNRRVPPQKALERVVEAVGVSPRTMNTLVTVWSSEDPKAQSSVELEDHKGRRIKLIISDGLQTRARTIGANEIWSVREQAKQMVWMYQVEKGILPSTATRTWETAKDERVCPTCGPMHGKEILVGDRFEIPGYGKAWAPPLHPSCRCDIRLNRQLDLGLREQVRERVNEPVGKRQLVMKARPGDPYDRDNSGRFAATERRDTKPQVTTKTRTEMDASLLDAMTKPVTETRAKFTPSSDTKSSTKFMPSEDRKFSTRSEKFSPEPEVEQRDKFAPEKFSTREKIRTRAKLGAQPKMGTREKLLLAEKFTVDAERNKPQHSTGGKIDIEPQVIAFDKVNVQQDEDGNTFFVTKREPWEPVAPDPHTPDQGRDYSQLLDSNNAHNWYQRMDDHWHTWRQEMSSKFDNAGEYGLRFRRGNGEVVEIVDQQLWNLAIDYAIYRDPAIGDMEFPVEVQAGNDPDDMIPDHATVREVAKAQVFGAMTNMMQLFNDVETKRPTFFVATEADMYRAEVAASKHGTSILPGKWQVYDWYDYPDTDSDGENSGSGVIPPHTIGYVHLVLDPDPDLDD